MRHSRPKMVSSGNAQPERKLVHCCFSRVASPRTKDALYAFCRSLPMENSTSNELLVVTPRSDGGKASSSQLN